ncbi:hypothetical protein CONPUDRAFT_75883 [Coniophora puteana RWD-64-598 SS2]|uniref:Uncharacterized protein n=1 Tax=Coniophora puteana (strain RWD-64-598) TaxID=741705 RepID=A0A5M3MDW1_CONPW|nr:uncharacterized protein CONPUDRAFT_75883 [Coniophora puteana RWD-64-598 SS2]EIW77070.1 hypothetical protein CONPUDRAFT_75883 [Coniophora puteana RWD-64-598 SS2]
MSVPLITNSPEVIPLLITSQGNNYLAVSFGALAAYDYSGIILFILVAFFVWVKRGVNFRGYRGVMHPFLFTIKVFNEQRSVLHMVVQLSVPYVLEAILQGVMTACVCVFYKSTRNILTCVYVGFLLAHLVSAALNIMESLPPYGYTFSTLIWADTTVAVYMGLPYCITLNPTLFLAWLNPVDAAISLGLEMILFLMMLYRSICYLRENKDFVRQFKSVAQVIFQQGLLYFVWCVLCSPSTKAVMLRPRQNLETVVLTNIGWILQMMLLCMIGPWFILSIRKHDMVRVKGGADIPMRSLSAMVFLMPNLPEEHAVEIGDMEDIGTEQQGGVFV